MLSPPMFLIASRTFWPSARTPRTTSSEIGSGFAVEPHAHHRAVENQPHDRLVGQRAGIPGVPVALHLAPDSAHRVLAHRAAKQGAKRAAYPARIGAGQIGARDQRVGSERAALIGPQCLALPFRRLAVGSVQPGARHVDLDLAEAFPSACATGCHADGRLPASSPPLRRSASSHAAHSVGGTAPRQVRPRSSSRLTREPGRAPQPSIGSNQSSKRWEPSRL